MTHKQMREFKEHFYSSGNKRDANVETLIRLNEDEYNQLREFILGSLENPPNESDFNMLRELLILAVRTLYDWQTQDNIDQGGVNWAYSFSPRPRSQEQDDAVNILRARIAYLQEKIAPKFNLIRTYTGLASWEGFPDYYAYPLTKEELEEEAADAALSDYLGHEQKAHWLRKLAQNIWSGIKGFGRKFSDFTDRTC